MATRFEYVPFDQYRRLKDARLTLWHAWRYLRARTGELEGMELLMDVSVLVTKAMHGEVEVEDA